MKILRTTNVPGEFTFWCPGCKGYHGVWTQPRPEGGPVWQWNGNIESPTFHPSLLISYNRWEPPVTPENIDQWEKEKWEQKEVKRSQNSQRV